MAVLIVFTNIWKSFNICCIYLHIYMQHIFGMYIEWSFEKFFSYRDALVGLVDWVWLSVSLFASVEGTFASDERWLRSKTDSCSSTGTGATAGSTGIGGVWWCNWLEPIAPKLLPNEDPAPLTKCRPVNKKVCHQSLFVNQISYLQIYQKITVSK